MSSIIPASRSVVTLTDRALPSHLLSLVRRVALRDRPAFAEIYDAVSARLGADLRSAGFAPDEAIGVVSATFVEVWQMARFHSGPDVDVEVWLSAIAGRRSAERRLARSQASARAGPSADATEPWWVAFADDQDRLSRITLAKLLRRSMRDIR
jgi:DNA-directed RNA polymerase specialized sigma24 family protein